MLKGHATIELTNVKTGEVEKYEEDNLITNAASEQLNNKWTLNFGGISTLNSWHLPLSTKAMSGIALFENTIEENPNITYFPENNRVVGFGGTIADEGRDPYWGSRNLAESESFDPITKRAKYVWDFKTNQAIGQISAVGLMDGRQGNYYGDSIWHPHYGERINMTSYFTTNQAKYMIEWEDDIFTCVRVNANKAIIEKYIFDNDKIGLNEKIAHTTLISTQEVELPEDSGGYKTCVWKSNDTHYYGLSAYTYSNHYNYYVSGNMNNSYHWTGGKHVRLIQIDKQTLEVKSTDLSLPYNVWPAGGYLVTNKFIILPYNAVNSEFGGNFYYTNNTNRTIDNISKSQAIFINLNDFSVSGQKFLGVDNKEYNLLFIRGGTGSYSRTDGMFSGGFQIVKLPNKTYMLNDLILNDDGQVIRQTAGPMQNYYNNATFLGQTSTSSYMWLNTCPFHLGQYYYGSYGSPYETQGYLTRNIIINKEKSMIIWTGANRVFNNSSSNTNTSHNREIVDVYFIPLRSQKLMTINNLETPIEKTSDKTMKITYILTEVDEETPSEEENSEA